MGYRIRPATREDSLAAVSVVRAVYDEYGFTWDEQGYNADLYDLEDHYLGAGHRFWVALDESELVVGTAALEIFPPVPGPFGQTAPHEGKIRIAGADCSLERLYVLPQARNSGLGSDLFSLCIRTAQEEGCAIMEIWSDKKLALAHRLYERFGASKIGDRICDDPDESPEWGYGLDLRAPELVKILARNGDQLAAATD